MKWNLFIAGVVLTLLLGFTATAIAQTEGIPLPRFSVGIEKAENPKDVALTLQILLLFTVLSLAPAILVMMTSFARIVVVLAFVRQALGTQQMPPNQVMIGLALFLTFFVMGPVWNQINTTALQPYLSKDITQTEAFEKATVPLRDFMYKQTREKDLALFVGIGKVSRPQNREDIPLRVLVPAFMISELKTAFQIGFLIYIPFLVIDMVIASVLLSMGMMMLPPILISLPFKLMLFVLVDGWNLLVGSIVRSFVPAG
jgi:flagellar biosynthetic protein FliP